MHANFIPLSIKKKHKYVKKNCVSGKKVAAQETEIMIKSKKT